MYVFVYVLIIYGYNKTILIQQTVPSTNSKIPKLRL